MSKSIEQIRKEKNELCEELQEIIEGFLTLNPECDIDIDVNIKRLNLEFYSGEKKFVGHEVKINAILQIP